MHIRLCMIVKNEAHVIRRCLDSVRPLLSSWCIVDTGSTDGTQAIITEHMKDLPGCVYERPWVQETINRNQALALARDLTSQSMPDLPPEQVYLFVIDADEVAEMLTDATIPPAGPDAYTVTMHMGGSYDYDRLSLVRADAPACYFGTGKIAGIHPTIMRDNHTSIATERWGGFRVVPYPDGASWSEVGKYQKHADLLAQDAADEPTNTRVRFYLAQSLRDAAKFVSGEARTKLREQALASYRIRVEQGEGGFAEEQWVAAWEAAQLEGQLGRDPTKSLLAAHMMRPWRAECLFALAQRNNVTGKYDLAYSYACAAVELDRIADERLFVDKSIYAWRVWEELGLASYYTNRRAKARVCFARAAKACTGDDLTRMLRNIGCC